jgi:hypothetical protein
MSPGANPASSAGARTRRQPGSAPILAEPRLSRAAGAVLSMLRPPAPGLVREGSSEPTPLFTRHTRGAIEAERDRRQQRRGRGGAAYPVTARQRAAGVPHSRIAAAVAATPAPWPRRAWTWIAGSTRAASSRFRPPPCSVPPPAGDEETQLVIDQDNDNQFHWRLIGDDGGLPCGLGRELCLRQGSAPPRRGRAPARRGGRRHRTLTPPSTTKRSS